MTVGADGDGELREGAPCPLPQGLEGALLAAEVCVCGGAWGPPVLAEVRGHRIGEPESQSIPAEPRRSHFNREKPIWRNVILSALRRLGL